MMRSYAVLTWAMAQADIRRGFLLNAEFEDHAEHTYALLVRDHPEWEEQPVAGGLVASMATSRRGPTSSGASRSTSGTT